MSSVAAPPPAWLECFCGAWEQDVIYSTSGPWWSGSFISTMIAIAGEQEARQIAKQGALKPGMAPTPLPTPPSPVGLGQGGGGRLDGIMTAPLPLPPIVLPLLKPDGRKSRQLTETEKQQCAAWYIANPSAARAAMCKVLLEQVDPSELPRLLPDSLTGKDKGEAWYRLKQRVAWDDAPGLHGWLQYQHETLDREKGLHFPHVLALIAAGGDAGDISLARPPPKGHPLSKDRAALCTFYRRPLPRGTPLGFYPGLLCEMSKVEAMMATLPMSTEEALARARAQDEAAAAAAAAGTASVDATATAAVLSSSSSVAAAQPHHQPSVFFPPVSDPASASISHSPSPQHAHSNGTSNSDIIGSSSGFSQPSPAAADCLSASPAADAAPAALSRGPSPNPTAGTSGSVRTSPHQYSMSYSGRTRGSVPESAELYYSGSGGSASSASAAAAAPRSAAAMPALIPASSANNSSNSNNSSSSASAADVSSQSKQPPSLTIAAAAVAAASSSASSSSFSASSSSGAPPMMSPGGGGSSGAGTAHPSSTPSHRNPRSLMCRSLVWSYDFGAPSLPQTGQSFTFQGTFVRNVLSGINDYHRIGERRVVVGSRLTSWTSASAKATIHISTSYRFPPFPVLNRFVCAAPTCPRCPSCWVACCRLCCSPPIAPWPSTRRRCWNTARTGTTPSAGASCKHRHRTR